MTTEPIDLYAILGLARDATQAQISVAYRTLLRRYHPDTRLPADISARHDLRCGAAACPHRLCGPPRPRPPFRLRPADHPAICARPPTSTVRSARHGHVGSTIHPSAPDPSTGHPDLLQPPRRSVNRSMDLSADNAGPSSQAAGEGADALRKASGATTIWGRRLVHPDWSSATSARRLNRAFERPGWTRLSRFCRSVLPARCSGTSRSGSGGEWPIAGHRSSGGTLRRRCTTCCSPCLRISNRPPSATSYRLSVVRGAVGVTWWNRPEPGLADWRNYYEGLSVGVLSEAEAAEWRETAARATAELSFLWAFGYHCAVGTKH